jgi:deazaflavin-dependent oxidoreductase (nitroreductase family)
MRRLVGLGALAAAIGAAVMWWRGNRRFGASYVNRVIDPWLVRQGIVSKSEGELGLLEHVGRKSGLVRVTPVHPVATDTGFRIIVPLGEESHWAQNVLAAGHCRIQVGEVVHELDEPALVAPSSVEGLPPVAAKAMDWLGFRYLELRRFAEHPGTLEATTQTEPEPATAGQPEVAPAG